MAGCIGGSIQSRAGARVGGSTTGRPIRSPSGPRGIQFDLAASLSESGYGKKNNKQQARHWYPPPSL